MGLLLLPDEHLHVCTISKFILFRVNIPLPKTDSSLLLLVKYTHITGRNRIFLQKFQRRLQEEECSDLAVAHIIQKQDEY